MAAAGTPRRLGRGRSRRTARPLAAAPARPPPPARPLPVRAPGCSPLQRLPAALAALGRDAAQPAGRARPRASVVSPDDQRDAADQADGSVLAAAHAGAAQPWQV